MNHHIKLASLFISICLPSHLLGGEIPALEKGISLLDREARSEIASRSIPYALFYQYVKDHEGQRGTVSAFISREQPADNFALSLSERIYGLHMNLDDVEVTDENRYSLDLNDVGEVDRLGVWPLTRWKEELHDQEVRDLLRLGEPQSSDPVLPEYDFSPGSSPSSFGCLSNSPLRYGDANGDDIDEIALYLISENWQFDWVLFSPQQEEVIFSVRVAQQDFTKIPQSHQERAGVQYGSLLFMREGYIGARTYAKIYIDDELEEGESGANFLVWRKRYQSREADDPVNGFELTDESLDYYERQEDGVYARSDRPEEISRQWLAERDLTWAKGYPNYSECEDEEGQLIPEMHDPLLNDPEVLEGVDPETMTFIEEEED